MTAEQAIHHADGDSAPTTCMLFEIGDTVFAVDALAVRQTLWLPLLAPAEELPAWVVGVFDMHGDVVPVIDLERRLGHSPRHYGVEDCIIVLEAEGCLAGVLAQRVLSVGGVAAGGFTCPHLERPDGDERLCLGEVRTEGGIAILLDHQHLLSIPDEQHAVQRTPLLLDVSDDERQTLARRAETLRGNAAEQQVVDRIAIAVVALGGEWFGIELKTVREFAQLGTLTRVPCCPPHILGNTSLRGDIVTVVDLRAALDMPVTAPDGGAKIVVTEYEDLLLGVPVEQVIDVLELGAEDIRTLSTSIGVAGDQFFRGELPYNGRIVVVLDLERIITDAGLEVNETV